MLPENSPYSGRPAAVTGAFWCQIVVAGLLVGLAVAGLLEILAFTRLFTDNVTDGSGAYSSSLSLTFSTPGSTTAIVPAAWLTITAFGLRRGRRAAYWFSLAGLAVVVLGLAVTGALGFGKVEGSNLAGVSGSLDAGSLIKMLDELNVRSVLVNRTIGWATAVLAVATAALLLVPATRRHFTRPR